jgi:hypothetical protein
MVAEGGGDVAGWWAKIFLSSMSAARSNCRLVYKFVAVMQHRNRVAFLQLRQKSQILGQ